MYDPADADLGLAVDLTSAETWDEDVTQLCGEIGADDMRAAAHQVTLIPENGEFLTGFLERVGRRLHGRVGYPHLAHSRS